MEARYESGTRRAAEERAQPLFCTASDPRRVTEMEKVRVLLVDDEPSFTRMLKLNLEKRGFTVMVENNGAYAYTVAQDFPSGLHLSGRDHARRGRWRGCREDPARPSFQGH